MSLRDIIVFLEAGRTCAAASKIAAELANRHDAFLTGLCHVAEPSPPLSASYAIGATAVNWVATQRRQTIDEIVARATAVFTAATSGDVSRAEARVFDVGATVEEIAGEAKYFDLAVIPIQADGDLRLAERVMIATGTPCIVAQERAPARSRFDRMLIAWNSSREAQRAIADAMPLLKRADHVRLVAIDDEESEADNVIEHLARHGVTAELHRLANTAADIGAVLLDQALVFDADLIVMGAYGHGRLPERLFGGVTRTLLSRGTVPLFLSH